MNDVTILHEDRLFPSDPTVRAIARRLYESIRKLPIVSPHGHTDARWFADNQPFPNPSSLFIVPDHYVFRMLYSQGIAMEHLGIGQGELDPDEARRIWIRFAESYYLFRGTPTRLWLDHAFQELFGLQERLSSANAGEYYDTISAKLASPAFRPRALYEQFNLEVLATTNSPLDPLNYHQAIRPSALTRWSIPRSTASDRMFSVWAKCTVRIAAPGRAISARCSAPASASRNWAAPQPIMGIRPPERLTWIRVPLRLSLAG